MSDSVDILKKLALQVRNASTEGENTAERIGRIFIGILENMDNSDIEKLTKYFLRKDKEDTANELITFLKGLLIGKNGSGWTVLEDGTTQAVVDRLYVKIKAVFDELEVKKKTHVGGEQIISPAGMKCVRVEELDESYRCFFLSEVDGVTVHNEFTVGTLALAQEFNIKEGTSHNVSNRYYWREVTGVGSDYIDLSKTNADKDSDVPAAGDGEPPHVHASGPCDHPGAGAHRDRGAHQGRDPRPAPAHRGRHRPASAHRQRQPLKRAVIFRRYFPWQAPAIP